MVLTLSCFHFCHIACFLTASSRKGKHTLNTFNVQMKFVTSLGSLMHANEVSVVCARWIVGQVASAKTFLIYPPPPPSCSLATKTLSETRRYIKKCHHSQTLHLSCTDLTFSLQTRFLKCFQIERVYLKLTENWNFSINFPAFMCFY